MLLLYQFNISGAHACGLSPCLVYTSEEVNLINGWSTILVHSLMSTLVFACIISRHIHVPNIVGTFSRSSETHWMFGVLEALVSVFQTDLLAKLTVAAVELVLTYLVGGHCLVVHVHVHVWVILPCFHWGSCCDVPILFDLAKSELTIRLGCHDKILNWIIHNSLNPIHFTCFISRCNWLWVLIFRVSWIDLFHRVAWLCSYLLDEAILIAKLIWSKHFISLFFAK